ncbi:hypothetical protein F4778DRAFT_795929 [Xylariomycetidae sp. FL2044]|nr:hypothetical protein F4778DRAFT_795929 [Xylariomycetidae sp. FL2044]
MFSSLLLSSAVSVIAVATGTTVAIPTTAITSGGSEVRTIYGTFHATNYAQSCGSGGCTSSFNLTVPEGYLKDVPGFQGLCGGVYGVSVWTNCIPAEGDLDENNYVQTKWGPGTDNTGYRMSVAHIFRQFTTTATNASGSAEFLMPVEAFDISVTSLGIAETEG